MSAQAGDGSCRSGFACGYEHLNFDGAYYGTQKGVSNWSEGAFVDRATSASANGASCYFTRYYRNFGFWDSLPSGGYFTLYSRQKFGENYSDGDLRDGAGRDSGGANFNDDIAGTRFIGC